MFRWRMEWKAKKGYEDGNIEMKRKNEWRGKERNQRRPGVGEEPSRTMVVRRRNGVSGEYNPRNKGWKRGTGNVPADRETWKSISLLLQWTDNQVCGPQSRLSVGYCYIMYISLSIIIMAFQKSLTQPTNSSSAVMLLQKGKPDRRRHPYWMSVSVTEIVNICHDKIAEVHSCQ